MNDCIHLLLSTYEMVSHSYICNSSCVLSKSCVTLFPCCLFCQIWLLLIYAFPCLGRKQKEACYSNPYPYLYKNCPAIAMCQQLNNFLFFIFLTIYFLFLFNVAELHACVVCIALPAGLMVVPTQGSYFVFFIFCVVFRKQI